MSMTLARHGPAALVALLLLAPLAAALVGVVGEPWRHESTGTGTTVTWVEASPVGVVEARIANSETLGVSTGGYEWRCIAEGSATITANVYVSTLDREPTLLEPVTCTTLP